jgi:uncharacterized protein
VFARVTGADGPSFTGFTGSGYRLRFGNQDVIAPAGVLISPVSLENWDQTDCRNVSIENLGTLLQVERSPEFLLLGTGASLIHPPMHFVRSLEAEGVGLEVMDSRSAARAWGVLRSEQRWIVGALLPL